MVVNHLEIWIFAVSRSPLNTLVSYLICR